MNSRLRIVVSGLIAEYPLGGVTWDYLQYPVGLARLGHDVFYIEDTGKWPYDPRADGTGKLADYNVRYLASVMDRFGLGGRWAYRFPWQSQWFGLPESARKEIIASADLIINISGCLANLQDYSGSARLVYIDSDPVFTQVKLARGEPYIRRHVGAHDVRFSFGEALGSDIPNGGIKWLPTRQPILLDEWITDATPTRPYTTVMNWSSYRPVEYQGRRFGQKDDEFMKFIDLPSALAPLRLELAMRTTGKLTNPPVALLKRKGWNIIDPNDVASDVDSYRSYIQSSRAEWGVAKNGYVVGKPGWFSCRSACYLAAGRPVIAQETGFSSVLPVGKGLFAYGSLEEAIDAVRTVEADYARHSHAARCIAKEFFDSGRVLARLIDDAMSDRHRLVQQGARAGDLTALVSRYGRKDGVA